MTRPRSVADDMAALRAEKTRIEGQLAAISSIVRPVTDLAKDVAEVMNYAARCRSVLDQFPVVIDQLRAHAAPDVRAIGNSLDALFRSVPVPAVMQSR